MAFVLFRYHQYFSSLFPASTTWMASTSWCLFSFSFCQQHCVCLFRHEQHCFCLFRQSWEKSNSKIRPNFSNFLVWHDSVKKGKERLCDFERLSQSSHARVTSVKSKQGQGVTEWLPDKARQWSDFSLIEISHCHRDRSRTAKSWSFPTKVIVKSFERVFKLDREDLRVATITITTFSANVLQSFKDGVKIL